MAALMTAAPASKVTWDRFIAGGLSLFDDGFPSVKGKRAGEMSHHISEGAASAYVSIRVACKDLNIVAIRSGPFVNFVCDA